MEKESTTTPAFFIGGIPIDSRLILAPMDGLSDATFRWVTRRLGSAYSVSEFINTLDYANQKSYEKKRLEFREEERPFVAQLLDNDAARMAECAARIEEEYHPDMFDINMGCAARTVAGRGAGVGLMKNPELSREIFRQVSQAVSVPVTIKIRLGWNDQQLNFREISERAVEEGIAAVAIHGRTAKMSFTGKARWQPIAELKQVLPVPIIGNGDVVSAEDARRMIAETGCDAVMIGRAAKANPWIFTWRNRDEVPVQEVYELARYQLGEMVKLGEERAIMPFRKYLKAYLNPYALPRTRMRQLLTATDPADLFHLLDNTFSILGAHVSLPAQPRGNQDE